MSLEPGVELPERSPRGVLSILVRVAIGVGVVAVLVARTPDRSALLDALREADLAWVIAAAATLLVGLVVSAFRWRAYLEALELSLPARTVVRLYLVGTFFNAFLPSGIGGDAYKAVRIGRAHGSYTAPFASVFLDRFAGFVALGVVGVVGVSIELIAGEDRRLAVVSAMLAVGMLGGAALVLFVGERLLGRGRVIKEGGIGGKLRGAVRAIQQAGRHPDAAARGYALGLVYQLLVLVCHLLVARALGLRGVSVAAMAGVVVLSSLATLIPLSPGGLGFREAAYVWALGSFGVGDDRALAFALLVLAILLTTSAIGGLVYVTAGGKVARANAVQERSG